MKFQHKTTTLVIFLFTFSIALNAQEQLNDYKYIVVQEQFSCQKKANDYQLNGLTQFYYRNKILKFFWSQKIYQKMLLKMDV